MSFKIGRNDPCWCGSGRKYKTCHQNFDARIQAAAEQGRPVPSHEIIKNPAQIEKIRESCKINIAVLDYIEKNIHEGMNTAEIDKIVYDMTTDMGGVPAPLNYQGYPYSVCTSINIDCSTILDGYFSDSSRMFCIGEISPEKQKLVDVTKECVELGLKEVKPWGYLGDMGQAVHDEDPWVSYNSVRGQEMLMAPGMIFTIEPMVNMGGVEIYTDETNDWEVYTKDHKPSAQWEIMVLVTEDGNEVLCW